MTSKYSSYSMEYDKTVWEQIYLHLKNEGFEVYSPGTKVGKCVNPYLVVILDSSNEHPTFSTNIDLYSILCYVPGENYSELEKLLLRVKYSMSKLKPLVKSNGYRSPSFKDDNLNAHMSSIQYINYKKQL